MVDAGSDVSHLDAGGNDASNDTLPCLLTVPVDSSLGHGYKMEYW